MVRYWCPVLVRMGVQLGWVVWVLRACPCHTMASGSHFAMMGTSCRSGALVASYRAPGSLRDMRVTSAVVTSGARVLVAPGGFPARRGGSHCPSRSLWLIAAAILSSSGISGSSSDVCGRSPVQTVPGGTWLAGVRSCTGHSGNCLSSQSSRFEVSTFSPHSGSACHLIFNCRLPCWPGVASLPCILPRNHTNCFGCPLSVVPYTPCTSAPSGHSGCMAARSARVKSGHAGAFGFGCGSGGGGAGATLGSGLGRLALRAQASAPPGRGLGLGWGCSGAGYGAGFGASRRNMLYARPCPSCGLCIPRSRFVCSCRLVVRSLRVRSVSVGQDIQRCACAVPYFRT